MLPRKMIIITMMTDVVVAITTLETGGATVVDTTDIMTLTDHLIGLRGLDIGAEVEYTSHHWICFGYTFSSCVKARL